MADVSGEGSLYRFGKQLEEGGGSGMLISGGCDPNGSVPLEKRFLDQIRSLKDETDLTINLHTGLVGKKDAEMIYGSGVDVISYDMIGDDSTIREVLHLDRTVEDYIDSYHSLRDAGLKIVPHILAGFHFGKLKGEYRAIDIASGFEPEKAVMIILIPTPGTPMGNLAPTSDEDIISVAEYMVEKINGEKILGCMRPKGNWSLESTILDLGFSGIVLPARKTVRLIRSNGWNVREVGSCCAADFTV